jgi:RNA polymerase sigma-70 factor (ECF subfamily)
LKRSSAPARARDGVIHDPDADVLARIAGGDKAACKVLIDRRAPGLLAMAERVLGDRAEAEDVVQDTFRKAWQQIPRWKPGRAKLSTWLHQVALNACRDRLRKRGRFVGEDEAGECPDAAPTPEAALATDQLVTTVRRAIADLPVRQREAMSLCHLQELSNIEAAAIMGVSVEAMESLLARGRRTLRKRLAALEA